MNTYPITLSVGQSFDFADEYSSETVETANKASGTPLRNKLFTFDPRNFKYSYHNATTTDKDAINTFYQANIDVPFTWSNQQTGTSFTVVFAAPPQAKNAGEKDVWNITMQLRQYTS